jgi:hypothetical protein
MNISIANTKGVDKIYEAAQRIWDETYSMGTAYSPVKEGLCNFLNSIKTISPPICQLSIVNQ